MPEWDRQQAVMHWNVAGGIRWRIWLGQDAVLPRQWVIVHFGNKLDSHGQRWTRINIFMHGNDSPKCKIMGLAKGPLLDSRPHTLAGLSTA